MTLTVATMPAITASVLPPRLAGIGFPPGRPFGAPGDTATQRRVLQAALDSLEAMSDPGTEVDLGIPYPGPRGRIHAPKPPPIAQLLKRKPWLLPRLIFGKVPS